jgi:hypothetical protein
MIAAFSEIASDVVLMKPLALFEEGCGNCEALMAALNGVLHVVPRTHLLGPDLRF